MAHHNSPSWPVDLEKAILGIPVHDNDLFYESLTSIKSMCDSLLVDVDLGRDRQQNIAVVSAGEAIEIMSESMASFKKRVYKSYDLDHLFSGYTVIFKIRQLIERRISVENLASAVLREIKSTLGAPINSPKTLLSHVVLLNQSNRPILQSDLQLVFDSIVSYVNWSVFEDERSVVREVVSRSIKRPDDLSLYYMTRDSRFDSARMFDLISRISSSIKDMELYQLTNDLSARESYENVLIATAHMILCWMSAPNEERGDGEAS